MRTIDRYVIREIIPPFLIALLVFTFKAPRPRRLVIHAVPTRDSTFSLSIGIRRTARRYDANTTTHSKSTTTAIPA